MIYSFGTTKEAHSVKGKVLSAVYERALGIVSILDKYYGKDRDVYKNDGGFVFIAENEKDLSYFISHHINPNNGSYEDAQIFRTEQGYYLDILFLCNNEFSINLLTPARLLPEISAEVSNRR